MPQQPQRTLTFKFTDATTQVLVLGLGAAITPRQKLADIISNGGFWVGDNDGLNVGNVWVNYTNCVSCTIS